MEKMEEAKNLVTGSYRSASMLDSMTRVGQRLLGFVTEEGRRSIYTHVYPAPPPRFNICMSESSRPLPIQPT